MKNIKYYSFAILLISVNSAFAQKATPSKKIKIQDYYVQTGFGLEKTNLGTLNDFNTLAPQSVLLKNNTADFTGGGDLGISGNSMFSMMVGFKMLDSDKSTFKSNPNFRVGVSYMTNNALNHNLHKTVRKPYDTLTSTSTGQSVYIDSLSTQYYGMRYTSDQLRLDGSLIYRTQTNSRWSLYAGIGINVGVSVNASTHIYYNDIKRTETRFSDGNTASSYYFSSSENGQIENFNNKTNWGASAYMPMGVDFRIGKKNEFLKKIHLFYDLRSSVNVTSIPELQTLTSVSMQHGLGIRVSMN